MCCYHHRACLFKCWFSVCIYIHVYSCVGLDVTIYSASPAFSRLAHHSQETSIIVLCVPEGIESRVNTHGRLFPRWS